MKKNGFIATSILYSFFLVFVTLFVALISAYLHNRILLSKMNESAWDTLVGINKTKITDLKVGDYIKFQTVATGSAINGDARWIVAYIENDGSNKKYYFMSDTSAQVPDVSFKASYDLIPKMHSITPNTYKELAATDRYEKSFIYPGFHVSIPTIELLTKIRAQNVAPQVMESIYGISDSFIIMAESNYTTANHIYNTGTMIEMRAYNFSLGSQHGSVINNYCGGYFDGTKVNYEAGNTYGYINVVKDSVKNEKYVNFCTYATSKKYVHRKSDLVVPTDENKSDIIENLYSSSYGFRLVATISLNPNAENTYIAGGKGIYMDPYLFTNGVKQG